MSLIRDTSITGYKILRRNPDTDASGVFTTIDDDTGSAGTSYTDGAVEASTAYVYRVKARNSQGLSPRSGYARADTPAAPTPQPTQQATPEPTVQPTPTPGSAPFARNTAQDINFPFSIDTPYGIWSDGTTMWMVDLSYDTIYAYNLTTKERDTGKDFDTLSGADNNNPVSIWSDGTTLWVTDSVDDKIYAYSMATKERDTSKDFDTLSDAGNNNPSGIWSDGTTMWAADPVDDKIYAYSMETKERDTGKDFDTLSGAGNNIAYGIWSDGTTMWVADLDDDKVYAYNLATKERDTGKDFDTLRGGATMTRTASGPMGLPCG